MAHGSLGHRYLQQCHGLCKGRELSKIGAHCGAGGDVTTQDVMVKASRLGGGREEEHCGFGRLLQPAEIRGSKARALKEPGEGLVSRYDRVSEFILYSLLDTGQGSFMVQVN